MPKDLLNEILIYNNNMIHAIAIRENVLSKLSENDNDYQTRKIAFDVSLDILKFEQRHLQRIIDKYK